MNSLLIMFVKWSLPTITFFYDVNEEKEGKNNCSLTAFRPKYTLQIPPPPKAETTTVVEHSLSTAQVQARLRLVCRIGSQNVASLPCLVKMESIRHEPSRTRTHNTFGIATGWTIERVGFRVPVVRNFLFSASSKPALWSAQFPFQWMPGSFSKGLKRPGSEAGHLPPTSTKVKKTLINTSTPQYVFMT
jgi:hypothetical protein